MAAQVIMAAQAMTRKAKPDQDEDARKGSEWNSRTRAHTHFLSQKPMSSFCYVSSMCSDVHESQEPLQKDWFLTSQLLYSQTSRWSHICKRVNRNSKVFRDNMFSLHCVGSLLCFLVLQLTERCSDAQRRYDSIAKPSKTAHANVQTQWTKKGPSKCWRRWCYPSSKYFCLHSCVCEYIHITS